MEKPKKKECFVIHHREDYTCPRCEAFYECRHCIEAKSINETIGQYDAWILERLYNLWTTPDTSVYDDLSKLIQQIKESK